MDNGLIKFIQGGYKNRNKRDNNICEFGKKID